MELNGRLQASFTPAETASSMNLIVDMAGSRANLDVVVKIKFPAPAGNRTPVVHPIVNDYID
jgi:hypothetical protein